MKYVHVHIHSGWLSALLHKKSTSSRISFDFFRERALCYLKLLWKEPYDIGKHFENNVNRLCWRLQGPGTHCTHCITLQYTATHSITLQHTDLLAAIQPIDCNTLQHTATHYNTLQHNATHCITLLADTEPIDDFCKVTSPLHHRALSA